MFVLVGNLILSKSEVESIKRRFDDCFLSVLYKKLCLLNPKSSIWRKLSSTIERASVSRVPEKFGRMNQGPRVSQVDDKIVQKTGGATLGMTRAAQSIGTYPNGECRRPSNVYIMARSNNKESLDHEHTLHNSVYCDTDYMTYDCEVRSCRNRERVQRTLSIACVGTRKRMHAPLRLLQTGATLSLNLKSSCSCR